jgi:hypothetical protein
MTLVKGEDSVADNEEAGSRIWIRPKMPLILMTGKEDRPSHTHNMHLIGQQKQISPPTSKGSSKSTESTDIVEKSEYMELSD